MLIVYTRDILLYTRLSKKWGTWQWNYINSVMCVYYSACSIDSNKNKKNVVHKCEYFVIIYRVT